MKRRNDKEKSTLEKTREVGMCVGFLSLWFLHRNVQTMVRVSSVVEGRDMAEWGRGVTSACESAECWYRTNASL